MTAVMLNVLARAHGGCANTLWIIAAILVIAGIVVLVQGSVLAVSRSSSSGSWSAPEG